IDILLTHMHLDHVAGLGFFGPLFMNKTLRIWGPRLGDVPLADRLAAYLGPPLFPMPFSEIPVTLEVTEVERETWQIGGLARSSIPAARSATGSRRAGRHSRSSPTTSWAWTPTPESSSPPAQTSCSTTRSTRTPNIRARSAGDIRPSPTSPPSCGERNRDARS